MKILILDDDVIRHQYFASNFSEHDITEVYTIEDAIEALKTEQFDAIFLDYDLGELKRTGCVVAEWISLHPDRKPNNIFIHSSNPVGARDIQRILPEGVIAPNLWLTKQ